jgi:hypothetical protein
VKMYVVFVVLVSLKLSKGLAQCPQSNIQITSKLFLHPLAGAIDYEGLTSGAAVVGPCLRRMQSLSH